MDYLKKDQINKLDEVVEDKGVRVVVDKKALMFLVGTEMDFVDDEIKSEFVFNNPNAKGHCGCGESFHVWVNEWKKFKHFKEWYQNDWMIGEIK